MATRRIPLLIGILVVSVVGFAGCDFFNQLFGGGSPATPEGLTVGTPTASSLAVTWKSSTDATGYRVFRDTSPDGAFSDKVYNGSLTSFTDSGLSAPFPYFYKVKATNSMGSSDFSAAVAGMTVGTYSWSSYGSWILYATNDTANCGYLQWCYINSSKLGTPGTLTSTVNKAGGQYPGDIGVIFGYASASNFWEFVVYPAGKYGIFQLVNNGWVTWKLYTSSAAIAGWGVSNELKVVSRLVVSTYYLDFYINGMLVITLSRPTTPLVDPNGLTGFIAEIGTTSQESFPDYPVFNVYKQTLPTVFAGSGNVVSMPQASISKSLPSLRGLK